MKALSQGRTVKWKPARRRVRAAMLLVAGFPVLGGADQIDDYLKTKWRLEIFQAFPLPTGSRGKNRHGQQTASSIVVTKSGDLAYGVGLYSKCGLRARQQL